MTEKPETVSVNVKYKGIEKTFSGSTEDAWVWLNRFFNELLPSLEIARNLWLDADLKALAKDLDKLVAFSPEGPSLLLPKSKLTDSETLILWLVATYLGKRLGLLVSDSLCKDELQTKLGKSGKITSTRLGELVKTAFVSKTQDERFRITTFGVVQTQKEILPKIRARIAM